MWDPLVGNMDNRSGRGGANLEIQDTENLVPFPTSGFFFNWDSANRAMGAYLKGPLWAAQAAVTAWCVVGRLHTPAFSRQRWFCCSLPSSPFDFLFYSLCIMQKSLWMWRKDAHLVVTVERSARCPKMLFTIERVSSHLVSFCRTWMLDCQMGHVFSMTICLFCL